MHTNDGNGQFNTSTFLLPTGNSAYGTQAVAVADFDLDGHIDLIFRGDENAPVIILFNDGIGRFSDDDKIELPGGGRDVKSIALADIDGDADVDIILGIHVQTMKQLGFGMAKMK